MMLLPLALLLPYAIADCTTFTPHPFNTTGNATFITIQGSSVPIMTNPNSSVFTIPGFVIPVMSGVTCNTTLAGCTYGPSGSRTTPNYTGQVVTTGGNWADPRRMLPRILNNSDSLWATIQRTIPDTTFWPFVGRNDTSSYSAYTILPGQSGYLSFTAYENCVNGTFSGCTGAGFPADGTTITACAPKSLLVGVGNCTSPGGNDCLDGVVSWTYTDAATAARTTCDVCPSKRADANGAPLKRVEWMSLMVLVGVMGFVLVN